MNYHRVEKKVQEIKLDNPEEAAVTKFLQARLDEMDIFSKGLEETIVNTP